MVILCFSLLIFLLWLEVQENKCITEFLGFSWRFHLERGRSDIGLPIPATEGGSPLRVHLLPPPPQRVPDTPFGMTCGFKIPYTGTRPQFYWANYVPLQDLQYVHMYHSIAMCVGMKTYITYTYATIGCWVDRAVACWEGYQGTGFLCHVVTKDIQGGRREVQPYSIFDYSKKFKIDVLHC